MKLQYFKDVQNVKELKKAYHKLVLKNLCKTYAPEGTVAQLQKMIGLDARSIAETAVEAIGK